MVHGIYMMIVLASMRCDLRQGLQMLKAADHRHHHVAKYMRLCAHSHPSQENFRANAFRLNGGTSLLNQRRIIIRKVVDSSMRSACPDVCLAEAYPDYSADPRGYVFGLRSFIKAFFSS